MQLINSKLLDAAAAARHENTSVSLAVRVRFRVPSELAVIVPIVVAAACFLLPRCLNGFLIAAFYVIFGGIFYGSPILQQFVAANSK